jgi:hypothetical protein
MLNQALSLLSTSKFADMAIPPTCNPNSHRVFINTSGLEGGYYTCQTNTQKIFTLSLVISTFWYYLATLAFEIPVLYWLGFRSRRAIFWAFIANLITVFCFHYVSTYFTQKGTWNLTQGFHAGFFVAEIVITIIEALIYILTLRKELSIPTIIKASILANACSAIIGGYIVNTLLGGFH